MVDVARLAMQIDVNGAQRARQALQGLQDGSIKAQRTTQALSDTIVRANSRAFTPMKGAVQQAGFQIGDFATQVASGQSALVAFTQQGTQLLGLFGPGGAILGAVLAIGGAIAGSFVRGMDSGTEATETLTEEAMRLAEALGEVSDRQREIINTGFAERIADQRARIQEAQESLYEANRTLETFTRRLSEQELEAMQASGALDRFTDSVNDSRNEMSLAEQAIAAIREEQRQFWEDLDEGSKAERQRIDRLKDLVSSTEAQAETLNMTARETALYEAARLGANAADLRAINNAYDKIEAYKQEENRLKLLREQYRITAAEDPLLQRINAQGRGADVIEGIRQNAVQVRNALDQEFSIRQAHKERVMALDDALRLGVIENAEERNRLEVESTRQRNEQLRQLEMQKYEFLDAGQQSFLNATSNLFGNLASIAEKGGKDQFNTWKAMASAQAAVSTALAVANALTAAPPPVNFALAASVGALGAVQIAQIQSQEYQGSYLGGGFTGTGPRTGGVDGKGGFPAILHPNETVIDHTMRNSGNNSTNSVNQTIAFQISGDVTEQARREIMKAMPLIREQAKVAVTQGISQGGSLSRAVGRRP
tara:strand:+ start:7489 stop:9279 length:1791 start_codon:yes stop_codon:yes gene_type:complete